MSFSSKEKSHILVTLHLSLFFKGIWSRGGGAGWVTRHLHKHKSVAPQTSKHLIEVNYHPVYDTATCAVVLTKSCMFCCGSEAVQDVYQLRSKREVAAFDHHGNDDSDWVERIFW